ncbi:MAG: metallophosphoesterase [Tannerellaceae bacterium]|jgi:predicted MPP superfamily phosphohydrolase|nr:metallophosphoesterase [Tannerellaceae bacterium]
MMASDLKKKTGVFLLFVLCFLNCDDKPYSLRSNNDYELYYTINNKQAVARLAPIMYNRTDAAIPVERFKLVHISDVHVSDWSADNNYKLPRNLIESVTFANQSELRINAMVATGDHISEGTKENALMFLNSFYTHLYTDNRIPTFPCYGNHDSNMGERLQSEYLSSAELANAFNNKGNYSLQRTAGKSYYYADVRNPMGGFIRFIALDMTDQPAFQYNTMINAVFSQEQIDWFANVALKRDMTDQHSIIVLTHYPFQPYREDASTYLIDGHFIHTYKLFPEIIEAFRSRSSIQKTFGNIRQQSDRGTIDCDFSESKGEFICYLGGHAHVFAVFDVVGLSNANEQLLPQRMILCTNQAASNAGVVFNNAHRENASISSNSFSIYSIDTRERKIYITYFGSFNPSSGRAEFPIIINY